MKRVIARYCIRLRIFALTFVLFCGGACCWAYAAEEEMPCAEEIAKYCREVKPGGGRILKCLEEHQKELSVLCAQKLEQSKKRLVEAQQACTGDMEKFCRDVQPGGGRILKCLREHTQELSPACRKIAETAGGKTEGKEGPQQ